HVDQLGVLANAVVDHAVQLAGKVDGGAVRQVAAVRQVHGQNRVVRFSQGKVGRGVGAGAGVRLDVGMFAAEQLFCSADSRGFDDVDEGVAAVVALAGVPLGILVGQRRAQSFQDGRRND